MRKKLYLSGKIQLPSALSVKLVCTKGPTETTFAYTGVMKALEWWAAVRRVGTKGWKCRHDAMG